MKKVNFNGFSKIKTPEQWVEKALNIPTEPEKPKPFYRRASFAASAACIVLSVAASLFVFLNSVSVSEPPSVSPSYTTSVPKSGESALSEQDGISPTSGQSSSSAASSAAGAASSPASTEPSESGTGAKSSSSSAEPSETSTSGSKTSGNTSASEGKTSAAQTPSKSSEQVTEEQPTQEPTEFTIPAATGETTKAMLVEAGFNGKIYFYDSGKNLYDYGGKLYCHISGDFETEFTPSYSASERCEIIKYEYGYYAVISFADKMSQPSLGTHTVTFYNSSGTVYSQTCLLLDEDLLVIA